jgi:hypothetical protein
VRLAILTGAGASFGAGRITPKPPPLGDGLYGELRDEFPSTWGTLRGSIDRLFRTPQGFESGMHELWQTANPNPHPLLIDLGRFFARYEPPRDGSDCYSELLRTLVVRRLLRKTAFATLNYECLLDVAAAQLGLFLAHPTDSTPNGNVLIWKPHGACNILPEMEMANVVLDHRGRAGAYFDGGVRVLEPWQVPLKYDQGYSSPPVMSLFAPGKPTPVAPSFVDATRQQWRNWVSGCTLIITIGVRPNLDDPHVWNSIIESAAPIWYVGGKDTSFDAFKSQVHNRVEYLSNRFDEGLEMIKARFAKQVSPSEF